METRASLKQQRYEDMTRCVCVCETCPNLIKLTKNVEADLHVIPCACPNPASHCMIDCMMYEFYFRR